VSGHGPQRWVAYLASASRETRRGEIRRFLALLEEYTPWVEHAGGCRAYLELGGARRFFGHPFPLLSRIRTELARSGLAISSGLGANKSLARAAADHSGIGGVFWVLDQGEKEFLGRMRIERWVGETDRGSGMAAGAKNRLIEQMRSLGIESVGDLAAIDPDWAKRAWGERGPVLRRLALGCDPRPVARILPDEGAVAEQLSLFPPDGRNEKLSILRRLVSRLRARYGPSAAGWASDGSVGSDGSDGWRG